MKRSEVVNIFAKKRTEEIVLTNIALVSRQVYAACHTDMTLYRIQMGYPLPMGIGLALALPQRRVIVLDGDGSLLMGLGALATAANENPKNLGLIVFDNQCYDNPGGLPSATAGKADLAAIARAAGVENSVTCSTAAEFQRALDGALAREGLFCIVAKVERTAPEEEKIPTLPFDLTENTYMFLRALTEAGLIKGWREGFSRPLRTTK
ncbi:MAG TPA: thiamine pyrophosphate-dependent enzyme [Candidatus Binatia bacterium]|jgi:thiamine pyrophosphate-dependent acetolactate synthase large subunit-like protein